MHLKRTIWLPVVLILALTLGALPIGAQSGETLSETYGTPGSGFSFNYPARWIIESRLEGEDVALASSRAALEAYLDDEAIPRGDLYMGFTGALAVDSHTPEDIGDFSLERVMKLAAETLAERHEDGFQLEPMEATQVAGHPAALVKFSTYHNDGVVFAIDYAGAYVWVKAKSARDTFSDHEALVWSILDTLDYTAMVYGTPALDVITEHFTASEIGISISYPASWSVGGPMYGVMWLTNDPLTMDEYLADEVAFAPVSLRIAPPNVTEMLVPGVSEVSLAEAAAIVADERGINVLWTETTTLAGQPALVGHLGGGLMVLIETPEGYVLVSASDGWGLYEAQIMAILDTLEYTPPAALPAPGPMTESYVSSDHTLSIQYPADWVISEAAPGVLAFSTDAAALDAFLNDGAEFPETLLVLYDPIEAAFGFRGLAEASSVWEAMEIVADGWGVDGMSDSETVTIAGQPAMIVPWMGGNIGVIQVEDGYFAFMTFDSWGDYEPHMLAILDTLAYVPIAQGEAPPPPELLFTAQHARDDVGDNAAPAYAGILPTPAVTDESGDPLPPRVEGAVWSADETRLLTWAEDGIARIWDLTTQQLLFTAPHGRWTRGPVLNADETLLMTQSGDNTLTVWDLTTGESRFTVQHDDILRGVAWNVDETRLLTWSRDGSARIWDAATGELLFTAQHEEDVYDAAWNADETRLFTRAGHTAQVWDLTTGEAIFTAPHEDYVYGAEWNTAETRLLTRSGLAVQVWDLTTGDVVFTAVYEESVSNFAWNADETRLLTQSGDTIQVWDLTTGEQLFIARHDARVRRAMWNRDGTRILSWAEDGIARIWDAATGEQLFIDQHDVWDSVIGAMWNADETQLLTRSALTVQIWDLTTGERLFTFQHENAILSAAWNQDETRLLTRSGLTVQVWDLTTGELLFTAQHEAVVSGAEWNADETRLLTWSADGTARVWDLTVEQQR